VGNQRNCKRVVGKKQKINKRNTLGVPIQTDDSPKRNNFKNEELLK
jgi:hypothetical protein